MQCCAFTKQHLSAMMAPPMLPVPVQARMALARMALARMERARMARARPLPSWSASRSYGRKRQSNHQRVARENERK